MVSDRKKILLSILLVLGSAILLVESAGSVVAPFIIAGIVGYLLHPLVTKLSNIASLSHNIAFAVIYILLIGVIVAVILLLIPLIYDQIAYFIERMPKYNKYVTQQLIPDTTDYISKFDPYIASKISIGLQNLASAAFTGLGESVQSLWAYTLATLNVMIFILLLPIILFYLLRDWEIIITSINNLFPHNARYGLVELARDIDTTLASYLRGQLNLCLLMSVVYSIGLQLIGVDFALILGIFSGFIIVLPFIGVCSAICINLIVCYFEYGVGDQIIYVLLLLGIGHFIEGYVLAPRIIGKKIGLHPLWILFSVLLGAQLAGFLGMLIAIPVAGIIKVIILRLLGFYKDSEFYTQ